MRVIVVVPSATSAERSAVDLVGEVRRHLGVEPHVVWGGDPHLRPVALPGTGWTDAGPRWFDELPAGGARLSVEPRLVGLLHALAVVAASPDDGPVLVLDASCAALLAAVELPQHAVGVVVRRLPPQPDGLAPTSADLAALGPYGRAALSVRPADCEAIARRLIEAGPDLAPGVALGVALDGVAVEALPAEIVGWSPVVDGAVAIVDGEDLDPAEPWRLNVRSRLRSSPASRIARLGALRCDPPPTTRLPGGITVDSTIRRLVAAALTTGTADGPVPDPWAEPSAFVRWLATPARPWEPAIGRYWNALWHGRRDLQQAFPHPAGHDLVGFRRWAARRHRWESHSPMLPALAEPVAPWRDAGRQPGGVDLVGYFGAEVSLANVTDRIRAGLDVVGVPYRTVDFRRTGSPRRTGVETADELAHESAVLVLNPDQVPAVLAEHGDVLAGRRLFGFWHWDVEYVPPDVVDAMRHFEQIWVLNEFTERSLAAASPGVPVRSLPLPVPEPRPSAATRSDLGLPDDRLVVLVTFDHLSMTERKNPYGAIEAFRRAFPEPAPDGPLLVVKSMNGHIRWAEDERVRFTAAGRSDIVVIDRLLPKADQLALIGHADVLLSLHRSEGLGLHLVEAMWLGTPTIATRYSGNLSFMDDDNSLLVDATLVPVERTEGFYPPEARWAEPDLDQAAAHLRRLVADPGLRARLATAGRARVERQPTFADTGRSIAAWCGIEVR